MRVGVVGPVYPDSFADNILDTLPRIGHVGVSLGPALPRPKRPGASRTAAVLGQSTAIASRFQRRLVERAKEQDLDVILTVEATLLPLTVAALNGLGCKTALWFPDAAANLGRQLPLVSPFHGLFFKDRLFVDRVAATTGKPVYYLPEACNPSWHAPTGGGEVEHAVVLAGNMYPSRLAVLERLMRAGVPLRVYGTGVPRWVGSSPVRSLPLLPAVRRGEKARVFRRALAVLNNLHPAEMNSVNCRLFEATGSGAAVLCEDRPVLAELYECGTEVLPFSSFDELMDRIRYLVADEAAGTEIGDAAARRAHRDHTYDVRLEHLLAILRAN